MKITKLIRLFFLLSLLLILLFNFNLSTYASIEKNPKNTAQEKNYMSHEILVKFKSSVNEIEKESIRQSVKAIRIRFIKSIQLEYWKLPKDMIIDEALKILKGVPLIEHVEPNYLCKPHAIPNDPHFNKLWYLKNTGQSINGSEGKIGADISVSSAWNMETGNHGIIIAVIDSGVAYDHPDLTNNIWTNKKEIPENGIDDDENGYIDDVHGWDFFYDDNDPSDYSVGLCGSGHGTHVAGVIAAQGNNAIGVTGVMWKAQIMPLQVYDFYESGSHDKRLISELNIISAIDYAVNNGAKIINCSFGGDYIFSKFMYDIIEYANQKGVLIVASAGNRANNNDENPHYPSSYDLSNLVSVAATNHKDELTSYSNFGPQTVDIAAPGGGDEIPSIYSTIPPKRDILFSDDFEFGKGNWATSNWSIGTDSIENSRCIIDSISNYKEDEESCLQTSSPIIIKNCKGLHLEFRIIYELEDGNDYLFLDGSFDGQNFFNICYFTGSAGYETKKYYTWTNDRNKEELHLRFLLKTDSSINKDGVYIDDIKLTGIPWEFTGDEYDYKMGTSMAAPIVSGIAGLIWSYKPHLSHLEVKNALLNSVDKLSSLRGKILTGGRVNAFNALVYEQAQEINKDEEGSGCFINSIFF